MASRALSVTIVLCLALIVGVAAAAAAASYSVTASETSNCVLDVTASWDAARVVSLHIGALYAPTGDTTYQLIRDVTLDKPLTHGSVEEQFTFSPSTVSSSGIAGAGVVFYSNNPRHDAEQGSGVISFTCS